MSQDDFVKLENVAVTYGRDAAHSVTALDETNLRIGKGDFIALVGPSGCGKSTILKLVGGLIPVSRGYVYVAGRELGAEPMRIGMAFQNPTMLPWLSIRDNVMLPLKIVPPFRREYRAKKRTEFRDRADALLAQVGLKGWYTTRSFCCSTSRSARSISSPAKSCGRSCRNSGSAESRP
jgi:NitT/TauT family transport system ATP-binding protein